MNTLSFIRPVVGAALAAGLTLSGTAYATTVSTPASTAAYALRSALSKCIESGADISTVTMDQVTQYLNLEAADQVAQGKFTDRFELLGGRGPIDSTSQERLVVISANQISEDRRDTLGRYVVWQKDRELRLAWEPEDRVRTLLESAGLPVVSKGVWTQPSTKGWDMFHVIRGNQGPQPDDHRAEENESGRRSTQSTKPTGQAPQEPALLLPKTQTTANSFPHAQPTPTSSLPLARIMWSLVVLVAITGLWLLVRKSKK